MGHMPLLFDMRRNIWLYAVQYVHASVCISWWIVGYVYVCGCVWMWLLCLGLSFVSDLLECKLIQCQKNIYFKCNISQSDPFICGTFVWNGHIWISILMDSYIFCLPNWNNFFYCSLFLLYRNMYIISWLRFGFLLYIAYCKKNHMHLTQLNN